MPGRSGLYDTSYAEKHQSYASAEVWRLRSFTSEADHVPKMLPKGRVPSVYRVHIGRKTADMEGKSFMYFNLKSLLVELNRLLIKLKS